MSIQHWRNCCTALGWTDADAWHEQLVAAYSEPQRAYHTLQHLDECLTLLDTVSCAWPALVEIALWFHDAVYNPKASDNEERSADLASEALTGFVDSTVIAEVRRLITLTKTHQPGDGVDDAALIDIDLAILGHNSERFDEYERQIRQEYAWVPNDVYRAKRAEIFARFLKRERIFQTEFFACRFESAARANLQRLIAQLQ